MGTERPVLLLDALASLEFVLTHQPEHLGGLAMAVVLVVLADHLIRTGYVRMRPSERQGILTRAEQHYPHLAEKRFERQGALEALIMCGEGLARCREYEH